MNKLGYVCWPDKRSVPMIAALHLCSVSWNNEVKFFITQITMTLEGHFQFPGTMLHYLLFVCEREK